MYDSNILRACAVDTKSSGHDSLNFKSFKFFLLDQKVVKAHIPRILVCHSQQQWNIHYTL